MARLPVSLALAALLLAALPPASAQTATTEQRLADWDRNDDGALSLDEYRAEARAAFDAMDADRNGSVSAAEMDEAEPQAEGELSAAQKIALVDGNEDAVLSLDEYEDDVEVRFDRIDANGDDRLGADELRSGWPVAVPR